jgi:ferredoxin
VLSDGRPTIVASACDGCGLCVDACRMVNDLATIRLVSATPRDNPRSESCLTT